MPPVHDPIRDVAEPPLSQPGLLENQPRLNRAIVGQRPGPGDSEERWVGGLGSGCVLSGRLAKLMVVALDVENVIDDLECQPDLFTPPVNRSDGFGSVLAGAHDRARNRRCTNESPRLAQMHGLESRGIQDERVSGYLPSRLKVDRLSADHPGCSGCFSNPGNRPEFSPREHSARVDRFTRHQLERCSLQRIPREDREAVVVQHVKRWPAAAEAVIVHGRQIVVNQRVGVDELHGASHRQREVEWIQIISCALGSIGEPNGVRSGEGKNRPQTLSASKHGVPEGIAEDRGTRRGNG